MGSFLVFAEDPGCPGMGDGSTYRLSALVHVNVFDYHALLFGGFLGIGDDHYPMPWQSLKYNTSLGGYRTNLTADRLKGEP
jgi:hypothetical protein